MKIWKPSDSGNQLKSRYEFGDHGYKVKADRYDDENSLIAYAGGNLTFEIALRGVKTLPVKKEKAVTAQR